jgi:hypothetical protein
MRLGGTDNTTIPGPPTYRYLPRRPDCPDDIPIPGTTNRSAQPLRPRSSACRRSPRRAACYARLLGQPLVDRRRRHAAASKPASITPDDRDAGSCSGRFPALRQPRRPHCAAPPTLPRRPTGVPRRSQLTRWCQLSRCSRGFASVSAAARTDDLRASAADPGGVLHA